ncbi:hypothetical protein SK128_003773 [Halocaridina rubra]|uniref:Uncharacterized protein n=1 Tax=Halocaridina rubra TaxID=373956 RepID=A0AAN8X407_HALRR
MSEARTLEYFNDWSSSPHCSLPIISVMVNKDDTLYKEKRIFLSLHAVFQEFLCRTWDRVDFEIEKKLYVQIGDSVYNLNGCRGLKALNHEHQLFV